MFRPFSLLLIFISFLCECDSFSASTETTFVEDPTLLLSRDSTEKNVVFLPHEEAEQYIDVAVIGGGYTGVLSSILLASLKKADGSTPALRVHLFERDYHLLNGASLIPARLHLGGEYPKDMITAKQCLFSAIIFRQMFPTESILTNRKRIDFLLAKACTEKLRNDANDLTLSELEMHYAKLKAFYKNAFDELFKTWGDDTESCLFGSPDDFFSFLKGPEDIDDERLRHHFTGGISTPERGLQPVALGTILEDLLTKYNVHLHLGHTITRTDFLEKKGYKLHYVFEKERKQGSFDFVINAAWHESPYLDFKAAQSHPSSTTVSSESFKQQETKVYLRSIALVDVSACEDIPTDRSYFGLLGPYGGMVSFFSNKIASIFIPEEGYSYQGDHKLQDKDERDTVLDKVASDRLDELSSGSNHEEEDSILRRILSNAQKKYPFLKNAKPKRLVTRTTISWDDKIYQRQHIQPHWLAGGEDRWLQAYSTKATFAPLVALQVLGVFFEKPEVREIVRLSEDSRKFLKNIKTANFSEMETPLDDLTTRVSRDKLSDSLISALIKLPDEFVLCERKSYDNSAFLEKMRVYALDRNLPLSMVEIFEQSEESLSDISPVNFFNVPPTESLVVLEDHDMESNLNTFHKRSENDFEVQLFLNSQKTLIDLVNSSFLLIPNRIFFRSLLLRQNLLNQTFLFNFAVTKTLEEIAVSFKSELDSETVREFLKCCEHILSLRRLILSGNKMGKALGKKIDPLVRVIERNQNLVFIDLTDNDLFSEDKNIIRFYLFDALEMKPWLRVILRGNGLTSQEESKYDQLMSVVLTNPITKSQRREHHETSFIGPLLSVSLPDRSPFFIESVPSNSQESYLTRLWNEFHSHNKVALLPSTPSKNTSTEVVSGMGGIGKHN